MDRGEELKKWFIKMGYNGRFPTDLTPIYNASTAALWQEVMQKVKPREEVSRMRNEILIDHFKSVHSDEENLNSKLKPVEAWAKNNDLRKKIEHIQQQINITDKKVTDLERENKMKHLKMDNVRKTIEQHRNFIFLLNEKSKLVQTQLYDLNNKLDGINNDAVNLTKEMVKECTEKIVVKIDSYSQEDQYSGLIDSTRELIPVANCTEKIWNELVADTELKKSQLKNLITQTDNEQSCKVDEQSFAKLYAVHVNYAIKTKELIAKMEKLEKQLVFIRNNVFENNYPTDVKKVIELKAKEIGLNAGLEILRDRIKSMQAEANVDTIEIETELERLDACKIQILENVNEKYDLISVMHNDMMHACSENTLKVTKLTNFTANLDWADPLNRNLILDQIQTFAKYPLNLGNYAPEDLDTNSMVIVSNLLENTWSPLETLLVSLVNEQEWLNVMKSLQATHAFNRGLVTKVGFQKPHQSAEIVDKIMSMLMSCNDIEKKLKMVRACVHLWFNMNFKGFLSQRRLVDNHNYTFYEDLYNKFYQNFS